LLTASVYSAAHHLVHVHTNVNVRGGNGISIGSQEEDVSAIFWLACGSSGSSWKTTCTTPVKRSTASPAKTAHVSVLRQIPGVGPLVSTAVVAAVGNGAAFRRGRGFAAWLGLVPRQHSTGGKTVLLGISKRGSIYLRRMFIHGPRAVLLHVKYDTGRLGQWARELAQRAPRNKLIVALANKLARIAIDAQSGHLDLAIAEVIEPSTC
jgi:Transposase IS116/IS110/IS902 family